MPVEKKISVIKESLFLVSKQLERTVQVDLYGTGDRTAETLLLINDGQDLEQMGLPAVLDELWGRGLLDSLVCVGIHAGPDRIQEYGVAGYPDYRGRGSRADAYTRFVFEELMPAIQGKVPQWKEKAFAGWSLGALSAMDIVWQYPQEFTRAGLFSGSFWWRKKDKDDPGYDERVDRIMQDRVRSGGYHPGLKFFFECGTADETEDRNHNGIIDSIDDTRDLINELMAKGYKPRTDIKYIEIDGGRHEVGTWAHVMPEFLRWGWGK